MADGSYNERIIQIDLATVGARVILGAATRVWVGSIVVSGLGPDTNVGSLYLRHRSASGPEIWSLEVPSVANGTQYNVVVPYPHPVKCQGLYMPAIANAWQGTSAMYIQLV